MEKRKQIKRPRKRGTGRVMKTVSLSFGPDTVKDLEWLQRPYGDTRSLLVEGLVRDWIHEQEQKILEDPDCTTARYLRKFYPAEFAKRYPQLAGNNGKVN